MFEHFSKICGISTTFSLLVTGNPNVLLGSQKWHICMQNNEKTEVPRKKMSILAKIVAFRRLFHCWLPGTQTCCWGAKNGICACKIAKKRRSPERFAYLVSGRKPTLRKMQYKKKM